MNTAHNIKATGPVMARGSHRIAANAPFLPRDVAAQIDAMKKGWMAVGKAFQDGHPLCEECDYCNHTQEPRAYGDGTVYVAECECALGQKASHRPEMCPAYLQFLQGEEA